MSQHTDEHPGLGSLYRRLSVDDVSSAVSVIVKVRGETCDIDCLYCYEKRKAAPGGARVSPAQIRQLTELFQGRPLAIELHGGEPLTAGRDHIAAILEELGQLPQVVRVTMQTNGVQLDDEWLDLFDELCPDLQLGISLDGDARGNAWRVGYDGQPVYPRVRAALEFLARRGRQVGLIAAVTPPLLGRAEEVLDHLAAFGSVNAISFVPCFDATVVRPTATSGRRLTPSRELQSASISSDAGPAWAITHSEYADFVLAVTARWIAGGHFARIKLEPAVSTIRRLRGLDSGFCHFSNLKCDHVFTLYPNGQLGSCDELPWPKARLVQLNDRSSQGKVIAEQESSALLAEGRALMNRCSDCAYRETCGGGCIATRWRAHGTSPDASDAYCDYRMRMVDGVSALLAQPRHHEGAWCRSWRWRPRNPNRMRSIPEFLERWDADHQHHADVRLLTSGHGNINTVGLPGVHDADDLYPRHPRWREAIEDGVWPLVDVLTNRWGLITYDSCAGHQYRGLSIPTSSRRVGLLPRTEDEYARAAACLCRVASEVRGKLPAGVEVSLGRANLECETTSQKVPVLDLALTPSPEATWDTYFRNVDEATRVLGAAVTNISLESDVSCACLGHRSLIDADRAVAG
ncbi:radical SAM protein [Kineosporia sp. J2-2]|uniref:Radical SAM protein n=1 Tax=Kineosporia corallincola TaxID=2835133 RepID=A0ABS5TTN1_9ACTN|nr:radical SAM protein [Kineosporia corallincola]MBT0774150.1 radical SAM protein [Kineosporia corallincola]